MSRNPETMLFLQDLMRRMIEADMPVVFKGYMLLDLVLTEMDLTDARRATTDLDAFWTGEQNIDDIVSSVERAVQAIDSTYSVHAFRRFGPEISAGIKI